MNLRKRLTLYSSGIFSVVFLICALIIFIAYYKSASNSIYKQLKSDALLTAFYYLEKDELPWNEHWLISKEFDQNIKKNNIAIYNQYDQIQYGNAIKDPGITGQILQEVRDKKQFNFKTKKHFYHGIFYQDNQGDFVVIGGESIAVFNGQMQNLVTILFFVFLGGITSIYLLSRHLSNIAYKPLKKIVEKVNDMDYHSMDQRIQVPHSNDELAVLINSYNELLQRLSKSINNQKNFINYASHEFRTPLTAISGNLQVFAQKSRTPLEYSQLTQKVLQQVDRIEDILNNLLLLSSLDLKPKQETALRVDEILWNIQQTIYQKYQFEINIDILVQNPDDLVYYASETLMELAIYNLIDNAVKYGLNKPVKVLLYHKDSRLCLEIKDQGKGIAQREIPLLKQIFFRGQKISHIPGSGIGLSLAANIFELYHIELLIESQIDQGTVVTIVF